MCRKDDLDPVARAIYQEDRLVLLKEGKRPEQLFPNAVIRLPNKSSGRDALIDRGEKLFSNWRNVPSTGAVYRRLSRQTMTRNLDVAVASRIAQTVFAGAVDGAAVRGSLKNSGVESLKVALLGAWLKQIDVATFEEFMNDLMATEQLMRYVLEGQRSFLVTDTLEVTDAAIELRDADKAEAFVKGEAAALASAGISASVDKKQSAAVVLDRNGRNNPVVIAFRAIEMEISDGRVRKLSTPKNPISVRGVERESQFSSDAYSLAFAEDFGVDDDVFVDLGVASASNG